jgi:DNA-binding MarR family transcriptional regulator
MNTSIHPQDAEQELAAHLAQHCAAARMNRMLDEELGTHHGIAWDAFVLLELLHTEGGEMPAAEVGARLGLTSTRLLLQVLPLEKLGLVRRLQAPDGARRLALGNSARRLLAEARETAAGVLAGAWA